MSFFFGDVPEELRQMIDRQHLEAQVTRNEVDRFIDELSTEDLITLRVIIRAASADPSNYGFFDGVIYTRLRKEGRCTTCGGPDHDHEAFEKLGVGEPEDISLEEFDVPEALDKSIISGTHFTAEQHALMAEYNLDDLRDEDTGELVGFICLNCGMRYPSIEDRMLRAPGECSGCYMKSAHG